MSKLFNGLLSPVETSDPLVLTVANPTIPQDVDAEFVVIESCDEPIDVFINKAGRPIKMSANDFFRMPILDGQQTRFSHLRIKRRESATLANNTVSLTVGSGDYRRGTVAIAANVTNRSAASLNGANPDVALVAAAAAVQIIAANSARRCVRVRNTHASADIRIATLAADVDAGRGEIVGPGETFELFVTSALFAKSAEAVTVVLGEEVF